MESRGGVRRGAGGGSAVDGEPGGVRRGAGGGSAKMLSRRSLSSMMRSTSISSTSIPGSCDGDMKESPTSSLAGGLKNIKIVKN